MSLTSFGLTLACRHCAWHAHRRHHPAAAVQCTVQISRGQINGRVRIVRTRPPVDDSPSTPRRRQLFAST